MERNLDDLTSDELLAVSRASEAKANVFRTLARQDDRYQGQLDEAESDAQQVHDKLRDQGIDPSMTDPVSTVPDKEGTAPTLADAHGKFAEDAHVANLGGIGIDDSNSDPDGVAQELHDRADPAVIRERMRQIEEIERPHKVAQADREAETFERFPVLREPYDEEGTEGSEGESSGRRERLPSKASRRAKHRRAADDAEREQTGE